MLPIITEDLLSQVYEEVFADVAGWRKKMVGHLKEENPEINSAILLSSSTIRTFCLLTITIPFYLLSVN